MKTTILGKTGEKVSILGFGCMRLPLNSADKADIDYPKATAMLHKAIDNGVNYVDTAYNYHSSVPRTPGESEVFVGKALAGGYREKVRLATKLPTWLPKTKQDMHEILDSQLKRLNTGHLDMYLAHNLKGAIWPKMQAMGMLEFFDEAKKDGRIKHAGFSFHDRYAAFEDIVKGHDWDFAQIQYNYMDVNYQAGRKGAELCKERGMGLIVMEPLRGGFLINHLPEEAKAIFSKARPDWTLADWGLRWLWNRPEVDIVLSGMTAMPQLEENMAMAAAPGGFGEKETTATDSVRALLKKRLPVDCTACGYCLPCPSNVNIPGVFSFYNDFHLMDAEEAKDRARFMYKFQIMEAERAGKCTHCKACEEKCPQQIAVSDNMEKAAALFGS